MIIKSLLIPIVALLVCSQVFSADVESSFSTYLKAGYNKAVMAIGEGKVFKNFDDSVFSVDIEERTEPDFVADINDIERMGQIPADSFDMIKLCNIPTPVFDNGSLATFQNLSRILKTGGTLEFNNMWGGSSAEDIKDQVLQNQDSEEGRTAILNMPAKDIVDYFMSRHMLNPFNHYLLDEDFASMNGSKLMETPVWTSYTAQLENFFKDAGFQSAAFDSNTNLWTVIK